MFAEKELKERTTSTVSTESPEKKQHFLSDQWMAYQQPNQSNFFNLATENYTKQLESHSVFQRKESPNLTNLPDQLKTNMEYLSGYSLDDVKVHYNSSKPASIHALAYTQGNEIHVAPGEEKHLPHEVWHVVQQKQGRVQPTAQIKGQSLNDDIGLEQEADVIGAKAIQMKVADLFSVHQTNSSGKTIQKKAHVAVKEYIDTANPPELQRSQKPTIVFESMGASQETADKVYQQTKNYTGNTICVFGYNVRDDSLDWSKNPIKKLDDQTEALHSFRNFSFLWAKPTNIKETDQYKMPFIEARLEVMKQADSLINAIDLQKKDTLPGHLDNKHLILYRWIDGDAENDTSNVLDTKELSSIAEDEEPRLATGSYEWRHESPATVTSKPHYHNFIEKINHAEHLLRQKYYDIQMEEKSDIQMEEKSDSQINYNDNNYLPGFYLPETTLLMNSRAHDLIKGASYFFNESEQSKESMKIAEHSGVEPKNISFLPTLSVSKPLKKEFSSSPAESYILNSRMKNLFKEKYSSDNLKNALCSIRQSAFDKTKWFFKESSLDTKLDTFKTSMITEIENFLKAKAKTEQLTNFNYIQKELKSHLN